VNLEEPGSLSTLSFWRRTGERTDDLSRRGANNYLLTFGCGCLSMLVVTQPTDDYRGCSSIRSNPPEHGISAEIASSNLGALTLLTESSRDLASGGFC